MIDLLVANFYVGDSFDDAGNPKDTSFERRSQVFLDEVLWFTEAIATQCAKEQISLKNGGAGATET